MATRLRLDRIECLQVDVTGRPVVTLDDLSARPVESVVDTVSKNSLRIPPKSDGTYNRIYGISRDSKSARANYNPWKAECYFRLSSVPPTREESLWQSGHPSMTPGTGTIPSQSFGPASSQNDVGDTQNRVWQGGHPGGENWYHNPSWNVPPGGVPALVCLSQHW